MTVILSTYIAFN